MNCERLLKEKLDPKESLTLINHTNIYEDDDRKGDYDELSVGKSKIQNFKLDTKSSPIPVAILFDYYNKMNNEHAFTKEFDSVMKGKLFNWKIASLKINQKKNRYCELLPYDMNRVVLSAFPNEHDFIQSEKFTTKALSKDQLAYVHLRPTCYINASYIDVLDNSNRILPRRYIATQGPLKFTIADFWKMAYQTNSYQIVM